MISKEITKDFRKWAKSRHVVQLFVLLVFFILPKPIPFISGLESGILRFDFAAWQIHFFGITLVPGTLHIFYLAFIIPLFALAVISSLYSKIFCGWICPQNIFYEMFEAVHNLLRKKFPSYRKSPKLQDFCDFSMAVIWGALITWTADSYFVGAQSKLHFVMMSALFIFFVFDTHWLKHDFCKNACPYAHLQKSFQRGNSLHVAWEDRPGNNCGICTACEKACYVDINVREAPFHHDCTMCGACIDACNKVFSRRPEPSLLQFEFEEGKKNYGGINTWPKLFICIAFALFLAYFTWMVINRPQASFRIDYPVGGTEKQLPAVVDGYDINYFTVRVRSMSDEHEEFRLELLSDGYEIHWIDCAECVQTLDPFTKGQAEVIIRRPVDDTAPTLDIIYLQLRRLRDNSIIGGQEVYFKTKS